LYSQNWNVSAGSDSHAVIAAVLICLWSFVGVESAAVSSGMVDNPKRTVPLATMLGTAIAGVIYIVSTQMISGMFPASEVAASGAPFALATTEIFGHWTAPFVAAFTALACFTSLGSWMMLVGEAGKRAANDGNFPKIYGEVDKNGVPRKGLILASIKMTALMCVLMVFSSKTAHAADLFNQLTTDAVLLTMLPYFYSSINLIRFEGMTTRNGFVMFFSGIACLFCMVALAGAEGTTLTATFIMSLIILMFYSKKAGLAQYMEQHPNELSSQQASH
jgi:cadaverine:lysine antiporter